MAVKTMGQGFDAKAWERGERDQPFNVEYEGAVLATFEKNGYDDSDFFAIVWDGEKVTTTGYATTRGWTYPNTATVDATDEVKDQVKAWAFDKVLGRMIARDRHEATTVKVGRKVRVHKGRKVAVGTEGWVAQIQDGQWGPRVKLRVGDTQVWTALGNVEVIDAEFTDEDELRERTERYIENTDAAQIATTLTRTAELDGRVFYF